MKSPTLKHADSIIQIMQGLLASGHFTHIREFDGEKISEAIRYDAGEDFLIDGLTARLNPQVVHEAIYLFAFMMNELAKNELDEIIAANDE